MKHIIKAILWPISILVLIAQILAKLARNTLSVILSLISTVLVIIGIFLLIAESIKLGVVIIIFAWLVSPIGIVMLADMTVDALSDGIYKIREKLC